MTSVPALRVSNLSVRYGDIEVVRNVSFDVSPGERVGLIGPSGAGKTSVLNGVAGVITPSDGSIQLFGESLSEGSRRAQRKRSSRVGMVHQQLLLTPRLRVVHNVNAGRISSWSTLRSLWSLAFPVGMAEVEGVLARVGIAEKATARTDSLSGGQQQRVALARVLLQEPDLFLADEPVSAVDPAWSQRVLEELSHDVWARTAGLLVVLHDVDLATKFCDRLIGMRDGQIVFSDSTANISSQMIHDLYRLDPVSS
jgi:phosphonate transport system ATP-binding protein